MEVANRKGNMEVANYVEGLQEIINRGGPEISECNQLENVCNNLIKNKLTLEDQRALSASG